MCRTTINVICWTEKIPGNCIEHFGSYQGYTGRDANALCKTALDPKPSPTVHRTHSAGSDSATAPVVAFRPRAASHRQMT